MSQGNKEQGEEEEEEEGQQRQKKSKAKRKKTRRRGNKKKKNNIHIALGVAGLEWRTRSPTRSRKRSSCGKKCDSKSCSF